MSNVNSVVETGSISSTIDQPKDHLLRSFNAFTTQNPTDILRQPTFCIADDKSIPERDISINPTVPEFNGIYKEFATEQSMRTELAYSVGISASYGVFSGSIQVDYQRSSFQKTTSFNSCYTAKVDCGTITYGKTVDDMRKLMRRELMDQLNGIKNLGDAERFTNTWGTHLITGVGLGGTLFISVQSETATVEDQMSISATIKANYGVAASISAVATASQKVASSSFTSRTEQRIFTVGGAPSKSARIKADTPQTFYDWSDSCTTATAYGVTKSILMYELATSSDAKDLLKRYLSLTMLLQSLKQPVIFSNYRDLEQTSDVSIKVGVPSGYKILSGGATLSRGCSSWLIGSYPEITSTGEPSAWVAMSHDSLHPAVASHKLAAYAIAVYDPENILETTVTYAAGSVRTWGPDTATAGLGEGWLLTGGGCACFKLSNSAGKWINSSYPLNKREWRVNTCDYMVAANNVETKAYAVGIRSKDPLLLLDSNMVQASSSSSQHQNVQAVSNAPIVGGGLQVQRNDQGSGTRVQKSYPASPFIWEEYSGDSEGNITHSTATAYAIFLKPSLKMN